MGSLFYSAPEVLQDLKYDERCDLWSLGVTLFELYFGVLPYGNEPDENIILNMIDDENNFIFRKSGIANLDILFKCLLAIDPNKRMTFQELFEYVSNDNFMNKNVIFLNNNNKYKKIYKIIQNEPQIEYPELIIQEADNPEEKLNHVWFAISDKDDNIISKEIVVPSDDRNKQKEYVINEIAKELICLLK